MPGDVNRRTIQFPEKPATPSLIVQIHNHKDNARADEIAQQLAEKIAEWVPLMVLEKVAPAIKIERSQ
jgi:hypothetical protein